MPLPMPTDLTKLREAWEQESHAEREGYPRDHIVASEAAIDDLTRRAYDQGVADCLALVNAHELDEAVGLMRDLRHDCRGEKGNRCPSCGMSESGNDFCQNVFHGGLKGASVAETSQELRAQADDDDGVAETSMGMARITWRTVARLKRGWADALDEIARLRRGS